MSESKQNYKIAVIIVTFNGEKLIAACLQSILASSTPVNKIIIIDNASEDNTIATAIKTYPAVDVVANKRNLGFGKANNIGMIKALNADANYTLLINQDVRLSSRTIGTLLSANHRSTEYDILSPVHLNSDGSMIDHNFQNYLNNSYTPGFLSDVFLNTKHSVYECRFANAACWFMSRRCLELVGGFDPLFDHYGEDRDYINRLHLCGMKLGIVANAIIYHDRKHGTATPEKFNTNKAWNEALLELKNHSVIPSRNYIVRQLLMEYLSLYFIHGGKNDEIRFHIEKLKKIIFLRNKITPYSVQIKKAETRLYLS